MIVERVLHVRSSGSMDFYDAACFTSFEDVGHKLEGGQIYLYGKTLSSRFSPKPIYKALDLGTVIGTDDGTLASSIHSRSVSQVSVVLKTSDPSFSYDELYLHDLEKKSYYPLRCYKCFDKGIINPVTTESGVVKYKVRNANTVFFVQSYTTPKLSDYTVPKCVEFNSLRELARQHPGDPSWKWGKEVVFPKEDVTPLFMANPYVPPANVLVEPGVAEADPFYMNYFLGYYNGKTPSYVAPHTYKWSSITEDYNGDIAFAFTKVIIRPRNTLPFINGYACWPDSDNTGILRAVNGAKYLKDEDVRRRRSVLVDFTPVGGATFHRLRDLQGSIKEFILPEMYSPNTKSLLLVLGGHLILPSKYKVIGKHVVLNKSAYTIAMEADRLVVGGIRLNTTGEIFDVPENTGLFESDDSFVVIINSPNMQLLMHESWFDEKERSLEQGSSSYAALQRNMFSKNARGLLYDSNLAVVKDYTRDECTVTFYAEKDGRELTWGSSSTYVEAEDPIVILKNTVSDNCMSAKTTLFEKARHFAHDDNVVWPRHVILDFIFRG